MSTSELLEFKLHLKEMLEKGYIRPIVSLWDVLVLFVKKKMVLLGYALTTRS